MGGGSNNGGAGASAVPTPSMDPDKPVKKKRKRCGECTGCQRKDNCGECAPCRNDKSHQICKQRRCERLTEKKPKPGGVGRGQVGKVIYLENSLFQTIFCYFAKIVIIGQNRKWIKKYQ